MYIYIYIYTHTYIYRGSRVSLYPQADVGGSNAMTPAEVSESVQIV